MSTNTKLSRVSKDWDNWGKEICKKRFITGKDKRLIGLPRLSRAITRVPKLKEILEEANFDEK